MTLHELKQHALKLPAEEREKLAETLLESVDHGESEGMDDATFAECERRWEEYKSGKVKGIPAAQVHADIRREMGWDK